MKVYVGNLSSSATDEKLKQLAAPFGSPSSAEVVKDRATGQPRGFGFIEFATEAEGRAAVAGLDGKEVDGQVLRVNEARAKKTGGGR